jgi:trehalose/maltose hydrolase-like predicted phosphorylase
MDKNINSWIIEEKNLASHEKEFNESVFSLGNGYMGVRGFDEEDDRKTKYELCTFIAGIYDYFAPGKTDMVNTPNFWKTNIYIEGEKFSLNSGYVIDYSKSLNIKEGILKRKVVWKDPNGNETRIDTTRFLSLGSVHDAILNISITPLNYSGEIVIETGIDADIRNNIINDDQMKSDLNIIDFLSEEGKTAADDKISMIKLHTIKTDYKICEGFATDLLEIGNRKVYDEQVVEKDRYIGKVIKFNAEKNNQYTFNKYISVWTSRDADIECIKDRVRDSIKVQETAGFNKLLQNQKDAWSKKWDTCDIDIVGDDKCLRALRYNIFELIQTNAEDDPKVSIGARGIMHGRYKGCFFWDTELFMLPFYLYTNPKAARNLLMYRYNTLSGAEKNAKMQNLEGARFAWMSAIDGVEQCESWDIGFCEVHITADIAYAVNQYFMASGDIEFIADYGLEILIKTARYWKSRFTYNKDEDKYNMLFVKGPNEYGGVTSNNLFTTKMAVYNLELAISFINLIKKSYPLKYDSLIKKINFDETEMKYWEYIIARAAVNYIPEKKLYIEDDDFLRLEPLDLKKVKEQNIPLYKKICFDRLQRYMVLKQPDVLLLMYLMPDKFSFEEKMAAWNFYEPITTHDSSLSYGIHSAMAAKLGLMDKAYRYLIKSACLDIDNIMGTTGTEGIHFASAGAAWQAVINGFGGIELQDGNLSVNPHLPAKWEMLKFKIYYKGCLLKFSITHESISIIFEDGALNKISVNVMGNNVLLLKGKEENISFVAREENHAI